MLLVVAVFNVYLFRRGTRSRVEVVGGSSAALSSAVFSTTDWVHVAVTIANRDALFYRNAAAVGGGALASDTILTSASLLLGNRDGGASAATYFAGLIDEAMLFNRVLTAGEIRALYATGSPYGLLSA